MSSTRERVRAAFLVMFRLLVRRAKRAMERRVLIAEYRRILFAAGGGLAAVVAVIIATSVALSRSPDSRLGERRLQGLRRAWENPERIARRRAELPPAARILLGLLKVAAVAAGTQLVRRTVQRALPTGG